MSHKVILQLSNHLEKKANNLLLFGIFKETQKLQQVQGLINRHWLNKTCPHYNTPVQSDITSYCTIFLNSATDVNIQNGYLMQVQQISRTFNDTEKKKLTVLRPLSVTPKGTGWMKDLIMNKESWEYKYLIQTNKPERFYDREN